MAETIRPPGKTTVAPEVLVTIVRLTVLSVPGVSRLAINSSEVERFFNKNLSEGIKVTVEGNAVYADVYVVVKPEMNVREVGHDIQAQVTRAISEMVGMEVGKINIHVEDVDYAPNPSAA